MKQYYVTRNNERLGPFADAHIKEKVTAGELSGLDLCWTEGMDEWLPIRDVLEISSSHNVSSVPAATSSADTEQVIPLVKDDSHIIVKSKWGKLSSWPGAIIFALIVCVVCMVIPISYLQEEGYLGWSAVTFLHLLKLVVLLCALQAIISARKKRSLLGVKSIGVRVLSGLMIVMALGHVAMFVVGARVTYVTMNVTPVYQLMSIDDLIDEMNQEPAKHGVGYDAFVLREVLWIQSGNQRRREQASRGGLRTLQGLNLNGYQGYDYGDERRRLVSLYDSTQVSESLIQDYLVAAIELCETFIEKSRASGDEELRKYGKSVEKQKKRLTRMEAKLADWMGAPDWDTLSAMMLSSYPESGQ